MLATDKEFRAKYEPPLKVISMHRLKRCLIIGDIFNLTDSQKIELRDVENTLIRRGKYPVLLTEEGMGEFSSLMRARFKMLLEVGSVYILPNYQNSYDAKLEYDIAIRLNIEIIYHEQNTN